MSFLVPSTWLLYLASAVIGSGAALIWTGQGNYLTLASRPATITRNSGAFWALLQLSMFFGNLFVFFTFQGKEKIDSGTRKLVFWVLSGVAVVGIVVLVLLPRAQQDEDEEEAVREERVGAVGALKGALKLFVTRRMLLLSVAFCYTGEVLFGIVKIVLLC